MQPSPRNDDGNAAPDTADTDMSELDDEELGLVGGGFQLPITPSEDKPFDSGLY